MRLRNVFLKNVVSSPKFKGKGFIIGLADYSLSFLVILFSNHLYKLSTSSSEASEVTALSDCNQTNLIVYEMNIYNSTNTLMFLVVNVFCILCSVLLVIGIMTETLVLLTIYTWIKPIIIIAVTHICSTPTIHLILSFECTRGHIMDSILLAFVLLYVITSALFWYCIYFTIQELDEVVVYDFVDERDQLTDPVKNYYDTPEIFNKDKPSTSKHFYLNVPEYIEYLKGLETDDDELNV